MHPVLGLHTALRLHAPAILCLHSVGSGRDALPEAVFRGLIESLKARGYDFLTADDILSLRVLRHRTVLLTFDDGRQDNIEVVLPILREYRIPATFYVCSDLAGREIAFPASPDSTEPSEAYCFPIMHWDAVRQLRDAGMCIGSHGAT